MKELRDIKLDLLMGNQNPIVDLFNQITKDIKIINTNVYNEEGLEFITFVEFRGVPMSGEKFAFLKKLKLVLNPPATLLGRRIAGFGC